MRKELVPGRECGACRVCCEDLQIDTEEIQKASGLLCINYKKGCCSIYETRPEVCRKYYCGWRMLDELKDDWRPDKSKILVSFRKEGSSEDPTGNRGIEFYVLKPEGISDIELSKAVMKFVAAGVSVFLIALSPPGYNSAYACVNNELKETLASGNPHLVHKGLKVIYGVLARYQTSREEYISVPNPGVIRQELRLPETALIPIFLSWLKALFRGA